MAEMRLGIFLAIFLFFSFIDPFDSIVTSGKDKDKKEQPKFIKLKNYMSLSNVLSRFKRDTLEPGNGNPKTTDDLERVVHDLQCERHNEAVVHWCGDKSQVIFLLTRRRLPDGTVDESTLYRSSNYGKTFIKVSLPQEKKPLVIKNIYVSEVDKKQLMFTDVRAEVIYWTLDQGMTYNRTTVPFYPNSVLYHSELAGWALGFSYRNHSLWYTKNGGKDWSFVQGNVQSRFYWGRKFVEDQTLVHMEVTDPNTGVHQYKRCPVANCTNDGNNIIVSDIDIYSLLVENNYIFLQKRDRKSMKSGLLVSYKNGPFVEARFPHKLTPLDFNILDSNEEQVFIAVNYMEKVVHLYLSDQTGVYYTLTLDNVLHMPLVAGFNVDLYEVQSMEGVYIANQLSAETKQPVTKITFDKGGDWVTIPAPKKDSIGQNTNCEQPKCSLHLHLSYSTRAYSVPYIVSEDKAPGMIVAQGSLGTELKADEAHLYMSSDGGYSWREVFKGTYTVNILDQGGAMVAVKEDFFTPTNLIKYSYDEGSTWRNLTIHELPIYVDGVLNEPGIMTLQISVFGHWQRSANSCWTIINLDFSSILKKKCEGMDYVKWTPKDLSDNEPCILGRKLTYQRRKADAKCFVGANYTRSVNRVPCPCSREDYECDYGYEEGGDGFTCIRSSWFNDSLPLKACPLGRNYSKSSGYRKIAADGCQGGTPAKKYAPASKPCPAMIPSGLAITASRYPFVQTGKEITFTLEQETGTKKNTTYQWDFGDGKKSKILRGFESAKNIPHTYISSGRYQVTLAANNTVGKTNAQMNLTVEDKIGAVHITGPRVVQAGVPFALNVSVCAGRNQPLQGDLHYVWRFQTQGPLSRLMTDEANITYTYPRPGKYAVLVQALNGIGSAVNEVEINVHALVNVIRLYFTHNLADLREDSVVWRKEFEAVLLNKLLSTLNVERNQLAVVVHSNTRETIADVLVYGSDSLAEQDPNVEKLTRELLDVANRNVVNPYGIYLFLHDDVRVAVTSAMLVGGTATNPPPGDLVINYTALFVALPIIILVVVLIPLLAKYYIRRSREFRHYRVLHNHTLEADTALDDDDDDDPLIDAGIGGNFLSVHGQFGDAGEPTLVMNYNNEPPADPVA